MIGRGMAVVCFTIPFADTPGGHDFLHIEFFEIIVHPFLEFVGHVVKPPVSGGEYGIIPS